MKKFIKSIIKAVLTLGVMLGLICLTGECEDMNAQIIWSLSWMAEMFICGWALIKLFPEDFKEDQI